MIKKLRLAILFLMHILFLQAVCGQVSVNMTEYLNKKFLNYSASVPREEIYIHSDRDEYISGEELWFNIYLIDRKSFKPSDESKIAYFELLNPENRPIVQKRILLGDGSGPGQIVLPDTLSTGLYTIRAYTSWMKNFFPYNCFIKNIHIYNAFSSKVIKAKVPSEKETKSDSFAMNYPITSNSGLSLTVDNLKPDFLEINVMTDDKYRNENGNLFYLFIQTHGNINLVSSELITAEQTKILIPKKQLIPGINQITVFNSKGLPGAERYIYTPDNENHQITIHSEDSSLLRKKITLNLGLGKEMAIASATPLKSTNFSISVAPVTNYHSVSDITDYMVLGSEFGLLQGNELKNKKLSTLSPEVIDSLLQNVRSNWINWSAILANDLPVFKYQIENEDHYLIGKLLTSDRKLPDPDKFVLMSPPGKIAVFQYAKTDKEGNFSFKVHIDGKIKDLIIQPDVMAKNTSLRIESSFSDQYLSPGKTVDSSLDSIPEYISNWSVNHQVKKIYGTSSTGDTIIPLTPIQRKKRFYGKPDAEIKMKDYIKLPVMQEVFFELLAGVALKNKKSGYELTISDADNNNKPYDTPPGLFIDGVAVKDPGVVAALDPELVETIDVVKEKYSVGDYLFYGVVNIITKAGDFSNMTLPDYAIRLPYRVIDPVWSFVSPDYSYAEKKKSRIPDFRTTLYWNPSVKPDNKGNATLEFWTSDFVSDFEVNIQGITPEGKTFSVNKIIKVKR
jgi:hypothetical protein